LGYFEEAFRLTLDNLPDLDRRRAKSK